MRIALITDTHMGHDKVVDYDGREKGFESRIIAGIRHFKPDVLLHLGDVAFYNAGFWNLQLTEAAGPKAKKWLVLGNHDKHSMKWFIEHGWDFVAEEIWFQRMGVEIVFTHRPHENLGDWEVLNIHGHKHESLFDAENGRICLHMPDNHYQPWSLDHLLERFRRENPEFIGPDGTGSSIG